MECSEATGCNAMSEVVIYSSRLCPFCSRAKTLLESKGVEYKEIVIDGSPEVREDMARRAGKSSVPQIWIGEKHIGGCDHLHDLEFSGLLDELLSNSQTNSSPT